MDRVVVKFPRLLIWMALATPVAMIVLAVFAPTWAYWTFGAAMLVATQAVAVRWARWSRKRRIPEIEAAHRQGKPRPWISYEFPRWTVRLAKVWVVLAIIGAVFLFIFLVLAAIAMRFG